MMMETLTVLLDPMRFVAPTVNDRVEPAARPESVQYVSVATAKVHVWPVR
jgi:hypothetical protein